MCSKVANFILSYKHNTALPGEKDQVSYHDYNENHIDNTFKGFGFI